MPFVIERWVGLDGKSQFADVQCHVNHLSESDPSTVLGAAVSRMSSSALKEDEDL